MNESSPKSEATANKLLSAAETLELLRRLREAVREIVARSQQLERDFNMRNERLRGQFEETIAAERERWSTEVEEEKISVEGRRAHEQAAFEARQLRITRALDNATKRRLARIETDEKTRTDENQSQIAEADRRRDAENEQNKVAYETFTTRLATECAALRTVEKQARWTVGRLPKRDAEVDVSEDEHKLIERIPARVQDASQELGRARSRILPPLFQFLPVWLWLLSIVGAAFVLVPELRRFDLQAVPDSVWRSIAIAAGGVLILYVFSRILAAPARRAASRTVNEVRKLCDACQRKAEARFGREAERNAAAHAAAVQALNQQWKKLYAGARESRRDWTTRLIEKAHQLNLKNDERHRIRTERLGPDHRERLERLHEEGRVRTKQLESAHAEDIAKLEATLKTGRDNVKSDWETVVLPLVEMIRTSGDNAEKLFPPWETERWQNFRLPDEFVGAAKFGELAVDIEKLCDVSLADTALELPGEAQFTVPSLLMLPRHGSILFETKQSGEEQVIGALNNLVLRLLTSSPPGRIALTIFDPVGLGQNFAGIMHLADFEERLINSRIWTQQSQIEERLGDLNEHIEKVTQMYLRNEYETLAEYNAQAGRMAEKYQFLVIADFPSNFSDMAVKRLQSIAASGPRCGVHLLIHWDQRKSPPVEFVPEELRKNALVIVPKASEFTAANAPTEGVALKLDAPPDADLTTKLLHQIGKDSTDSYRVEMPFVEAAPEPEQIWSLETTNELRVPIGRTGATKLQYLALGQGTRQHGLVAGKTGSGKSTLFHVVITNLSLWCSPEQVEFYLVDFKKGVEFKCYATNRLPHARVVAIESDREFGLSVLQRVDDELRRRGDLFRKLGVQDVPGYKRAVTSSGSGVPPVQSHEPHRQDARATTHRQDSSATTAPMPRTLLLIDEFQEFFTEDDRIAQSAALLLDRIVRQGRAFGIHVFLGSQTLGGAYTLARATIGQMVIRIALQCNEADAYLIMSEDNPAPRLLSRPGEAIYNDDGGSLQGNSPFQVVWLPEEERDDWLKKIGETATQRGITDREPVVFEGNAPAHVADNPVLRQMLDAPSLKPVSSPRTFLGAPNSIKGPTEAVFHRQSGNHLLIVGQREEAALGMLGVGLIALAAQKARGAARFFVFDSSPPDSAEAKFLEQVVAAIPHEVKLVRAGDADEVMSALAAEQQQRSDEPVTTAPSAFLFIHGLQKNKKLRYDEEMSFSADPDAGANPGLQLNKLICEGAALGFHVVATCDTYNNVMRFLSRKALSEFELRVVFQMSANDSASLIDSAMANNLGLHRAILFNSQQGWLETFRPYALPDSAWMEQARTKLARLHKT